MKDFKNALHLYEVIKLPNEDNILVTEFLNGCDFYDLLYYKRRMQPLREHEAQKILYKVADGLRSMADKGIAHRDIHI